MSSSGTLFNGKGALLPSVAGADALQPCARRKEGGGEEKMKAISHHIGK